MTDIRQPQLPIFTVTIFPNDTPKIALTNKGLSEGNPTVLSVTALEADNKRKAMIYAKEISNAPTLCKIMVQEWSLFDLRKWQRLKVGGCIVSPPRVVMVGDPDHPATNGTKTQSGDPADQDPAGIAEQLSKTQLGRGLLTIVRSRIPDAPDDLLDMLPLGEWLRQYLLANDINHDPEVLINLVSLLLDTQREPTWQQPRLMGDANGLDAFKRSRASQFASVTAVGAGVHLAQRQIDGRLQDLGKSIEQLGTQNSDAK